MQVFIYGFKLSLVFPSLTLLPECGWASSTELPVELEKQHIALGLTGALCTRLGTHLPVLSRSPAAI